MVGSWIVEWKPSNGPFVFTSTEKLMEYINRFPAFKILYDGDPQTESIIEIFDTKNCERAIAYKVSKEDIDPQFDENGYIHLA